jgi:chromosome segregation ATPase
MRLRLKPSVRELLATIDRKQDQIMTDVSALTAAIDQLDTDEVAAVAELKALAAKIGELEVGQVTQAQLDELTAHAQAVAAALEAGTATP